MPPRTTARSQWKRLTLAEKKAHLVARSTPAERQLMALLDAEPLLAGRYEHQACVAGYFPDFAFAHCRLIVELDGSVHVGRAARRKDSRRSARLRAAGWRVIRFWNADLREPKAVMKAILLATRS